MSKRTLFLIFALFIITFVLLMMALYKPSIPNPKPAQIVTAPKEPVAQTVLSFGEPSIATSSSALRKLADLTYSLPISITTGKNKVNAVQLEMQYDPQLLTNVSVTPSAFFKNPEVLLNQIDTKTGRITYAFGTGFVDQAVSGKGVVAILTFDTKTGQILQTSISFLPKTKVTAQGTNESVLKGFKSVQFVVGVENATSSAPAKNQ